MSNGGTLFDRDIDTNLFYIFVYIEENRAKLLKGANRANHFLLYF